MSRDYKKAQRERDKKKRSVPAKGKKSSKTVPSNRPSGTASGTKSSREKTYLEKTNDRANLVGRSPFMYGFGPRGTARHLPEPIAPLKPKKAAPIPSPVKGRDIPLPKSNF